jgi:hypothetical protein
MCPSRAPALPFSCVQSPDHTTAGLATLLFFCTPEGLRVRSPPTGPRPWLLLRLVTISLRPENKVLQVMLTPRCAHAQSVCNSGSGRRITVCLPGFEVERYPTYKTASTPFPFSSFSRLNSKIQQSNMSLVDKETVAYVETAGSGSSPCESGLDLQYEKRLM